MDTEKFRGNFYTGTSMPPTFRRRLIHGRTANFNSLEKRVLVQLVEPYKDVIDSKKNDATTVKEKENIWIHMTRLFNSKFPGQKPRESKNLQRLWKNIKSRARNQNTDIDAMLDAEPVGLHLQQPIKMETQSDGFEMGVPEGEGLENENIHLPTEHVFSTEADRVNIVKTEIVNEEPESCRTAMTQLNHENNHSHRDFQPAVNENAANRNGEPSSKAFEVGNSHPRSFPVTSAFAQSDINATKKCGNTNYERNSFDSDAATEQHVMFDNDGARSEYEDNILAMKQSEHEQRMKNLKLEREMKQQEHVLRMDLLKEEMELVRLRKELLKRQLESYINVANA